VPDVDDTARRPNVIWIFGDQHRAQSLSCMGDDNLRTPNIDRLAGTAPLTAVAGCPLCSPFRGSLLTGRYPHRCVPGHDRAMPDGLPTVAGAFTAAGYRTAYFGKWHVDGQEHREPGSSAALQRVAAERRGGFELWLGYENNNDHFDCRLHGHDASGTPVEHYRLPGFETDALTNLFIDYLEERGRERASEGARPFFAALSVHPPHGPLVAPDEWLARHRPADIRLRPNVPPVERVRERARTDLAGYYSLIENLDHNFGRIIDALEAAGLAESTYVLFFSDHGDMLGSHGRVFKGVPWEESIRVPFLIACNGEPLRASEDRVLINHVDIAPTTLGLCGVDAPDWMAGADYSGLFVAGRELPAPLPDSAFLQLVDPGFIHGIAIDRERPWRGVVTRDGWKYAVLEGQPWLMYDLNEDPYETTNLALDGRYWSVRDRLQDRLAAWIEDTGDVFALPDISHDRLFVSSGGSRRTKDGDEGKGDTR
jgi:arylsulfatase A-like enzyme